MKSKCFIASNRLYLARESTMKNFKTMIYIFYDMLILFYENVTIA